MIAEEVNRYKNEMLNYFHARQIDINKVESSSSSSHQYYTTSLTRTIYELDGYNTSNESNLIQEVSSTNDNEEIRISSTVKSSSDDHSRFKSLSYEQDQSQIQTFLTEDPTTVNETNTVPFYEAFRIPSNLVNTLMFKYV
jgi:PDZ domain-containing secreted protein